MDNVKAKNSPYNEFYLYANQNPYDRIYDENGKFVEKLSSGDWNPLYNAHLAKKNTSTYTSIQDNFNIDWRIIPALRLQGRISYTRQFDKRDLLSLRNLWIIARKQILKRKELIFVPIHKAINLTGI